MGSRWSAQWQRLPAEQRSAGAGGAGRQATAGACGSGRCAVPEPRAESAGVLRSGAAAGAAGFRRHGAAAAGRDARFGFAADFAASAAASCVGQLLKMLAHQLGVLDIDRARMRLLLGDADLRQVVDQHLGLDLEFPRQFVDADLIGSAISLYLSNISILSPAPIRR